MLALYFFLLADRVRCYTDAPDEGQEFTPTGWLLQLSFCEHGFPLEYAFLNLGLLASFDMHKNIWHSARP